MEFRKFLESTMPLSQAIEIMGFSSIPTADELKKVYRKKAMENHPDRGGNNQKMGLISVANSVIEDAIRNNLEFKSPKPWSGWAKQDPVYGTYTRTYKAHDTNHPPWETDLRSSYHVVGEDWTNLNKCKKDIYEASIKTGQIPKKYMFMAFDGEFFRHSFQAFAVPDTFGFAGEVLEFWNSNGASPHVTEGVFVSADGVMKLIRLHGKNVSNDNIEFKHDSFNSNPSNDPDFMQKIRKWFEKN